MNDITRFWSNVYIRMGGRMNVCFMCPNLTADDSD
ncbi:unnamed protein product [Rhodiola kirilowii]